MSDDQVRTAIAVLKAYADGTLRTDLCDELDGAIEAAWNVLLTEQTGDDHEYDENQTLEEYHREIDGMRGN